MRLIISLLLLSSTISFAQQITEWFPDNLNIQPFAGNFLEPKAGALFALDENKIRLDIGTTRDIIHISNSNGTYSIGADLFTYTRLRSSENFKFPVETIDYLFGLNAGFRTPVGRNELGIRFRFSHISAHLVDGQYDDQNKQWRDGREPFVFSKEFIELFPYYRLGSFRIYGGFTYIFHVIPSEIKKGIYQIGFDYRIPVNIESVTPFIGYDFKLNGINSYMGNNTITAGIKFGQWDERGISILFTYISGNSVHGEYYDIKENYANIGFNLDL